MHFNQRLLMIETSGDVADQKFNLLKYYVDKEYGFPTGYSLFGSPVNDGERPTLIERYTYQKIETNVGLTDIDFDVSNPEYQFPK